MTTRRQQAAVTKAAKATFSRRRELFDFRRNSFLFSENCRGSEGLARTCCALRYDTYRTNRWVRVARFDDADDGIYTVRVARRQFLAYPLVA